MNKPPAPQSPDPAAERRRWERSLIGIEPPGHLIGEMGGERVRVWNVGRGGIALVSPKEVAAGDVVVLRLYNTMRNFFSEVPARILHVARGGEEDFILGGAFTRELTQEEIQGFL